MSIFWRTICLSAALLWATTALAEPAKFSIEGVENGKLLDNIYAHLQPLDAPTRDYQFDDFRHQISRKVAKAVQVYGYYRVKVISSREDEQHWKLAITLGPQVKIQQLNLQITGAGKQDDTLQKILQHSELKIGAGLNHPLYETLKNRLQSRALSRGYFDFQFRQHQIRVDALKNTADVTLIADTGVRYQFGEVILPEDDRAEVLINKMVPFKTGDVYSSNALGKFSQALKKTSYFRHVLVRPLVAKATHHRVPIEVVLTHKPRDNFDIGGGVSSDDGPRIRIKWRRPWVNPFGHSLGAEIFASQVEQHFTMDYKIPLEDPVKNYASFQLGFKATNNNDTQSDKWTLAAQRHWELPNSDWQRIGFVRFERETFIQGSDVTQTSKLLIPGVTYSRRRSRGVLDVSWGDKQSITVEGAANELGSDIDMLRVTLGTRWIRSFGAHRITLRGELGAISSSDFDRIPSSLRYFAGGDQSVRGFAYQGLAPRDNEGKLIGGRYLAVGSAEYSHPVASNWRGAFFIDAGNAANKITMHMAVSTGIGGIWESPIGPIRLYLARGFGDDQRTWRLHLLMGPSL